MQNVRRPRVGPSCSGFIIPTRIIPPGRRSTNLDHAWPYFSYIIVSVLAGAPEEMTSWRLRDDRSAFDQEDLTYAEHDSHSRHLCARSPTRRSRLKSAAAPLASCSRT